MTSQLGITAVQGALYASTVFIGIINSISCQPIVAGKRGVMYREKAAGMYSVFPWVAGMVSSWLLCPEQDNVKENLHLQLCT